MLSEVVADNIEVLLKQKGLKASHLVQLAKDANVGLNKTFMTRLFQRDNDFRISKIDKLCATLALIEPNIEASALITPNYFKKEIAKNEKVSPEDLKNSMKELIINLIDLEWIKVGDDVPFDLLGGYMYNHLKKAIPQYAIDKQDNSSDIKSKKVI